MTGRAEQEAVAAQAPAENDAAAVTNGAAAHLPEGVLEELRGQIMAEINARLDSKADSLWRRGQAELSKLHQERKQMASFIGDLQTRQEALIAENVGMRSAMTQMTEKLEFVALEMQAVLRSLPGRAPPSALGQAQKAPVAGAAGEPLPEPTPGTPVTSSWAEGAPGVAAWCPSAGSPARGVAPPPASPATGSRGGPAEPVVRLSLAAALPSAGGQSPAAVPSSAPAAPNAQSSKTLQIAACLGWEAFSLELAKEPGADGLGVEVAVADGFSLNVGRIVEDGPVARHNARQESTATMVLVGDRIVEVNGITQSSHQMLEECRAASRVALRLVRDPQQQAEVEPSPWSASTPGLRAEAPAFVPSAHKESAATPLPATPAPAAPGSEARPCDPLEILLGAGGADGSAAASEAKVNRALFQSDANSEDA